MDQNLFQGAENPSRQAWLDQVTKDLKGADFNSRLVSYTDNIAIQPLYTKDDVPEFVQDETSEFLEDIDQSIEEAISEEGSTILTWNICEDIHTSGGYLNDQLIVSLKRGCNFLRVSGDWHIFFNDIRKINVPATFVLHPDGDLTDDNIVRTWREYIGYIGSRDQLITSIEFDPIGYFIMTGNTAQAGRSFNHLAELFFRLSAHLQDCRLIHIDTTYFDKKNTGPSQQLAYALAIATDYLHELSSRKVPLEEIIHLMSFRFFVGVDYFTEIAKLRAFKILWHNLLKSFIPDIEFIPNPYIHAVATTADFNAGTPHDNLLRTTTEAMSAILGGCDTLSVMPYDNADPQATRLATHIQNILRHESNFDNYREAANGSFYIETLTTEIAARSWEIFLEMESKGGFLEKMKMQNS